MLVPISKLSESLDVFEEEFGLYPIWMCPLRIPEGDQTGGFLRPRGSAEDGMYVDLGAYGSPQPGRPFVARESLRRVEAFVRRVGGYQALYADTYMTRKEFREMFDHRLYDRLRREMGCTRAFPEVYDKISRDARY
jgi:delta24-sterol reductase